MRYVMPTELQPVCHRKKGKPVKNRQENIYSAHPCAFWFRNMREWVLNIPTNEKLFSKDGLHLRARAWQAESTTRGLLLYRFSMLNFRPHFVELESFECRAFGVMTRHAGFLILFRDSHSGFFVLCLVALAVKHLERGRRAVA